MIDKRMQTVSWIITINDGDGNLYDDEYKNVRRIVVTDHNALVLFDVNDEVIKIFNANRWVNAEPLR